MEQIVVRSMYDGKMKMMSLLRMMNSTMSDACVLVMREGTSTCCMDNCFA